MADYFDPSPRASKRKRTAVYKAAQSSFGGKENETPDNMNKSATPSPQCAVETETLDLAHETNEDRNIEQGVLRRAAQKNVNLKASQRSQEAVLNVDTRMTPSPEPLAVGHDGAEDSNTVQIRSSGRERKRPRRYSISPEEPKIQPTTSTKRMRGEEDKPTPEKRRQSTRETSLKGILTPSRKEKRAGTRKSVVFDQDEQEIEQRLGFRDIDSSPSKKARASEKASKKAVSYKIDPVAQMDRQSSTSSKSRIHDPESLPAAIEATEDLEIEDMIADHLSDVVIENIAVAQNEQSLSSFSIEEDASLLDIKTKIMNRLVFQEYAPVSALLQGQYDAVHSLLHATVTAGESNSLLLLGARGTGKSHILNVAISDLSMKHPDEFHTVRLNGFYQTDDRLALREIWRQLGREMQVDEMEAGEQGGSYADTMSSLLSLLSHADELYDPSIQNGDVMDMDSGAKRASKSIIFVLDEFDLFTTHPRQTLLYNLFDIAQSRKAPIAVVGCSTRTDVVDCLEKRVKSRFSHRWLHVPPAKTLDEFMDIIRDALCLASSGNTSVFKVAKQDLEARSRWNHYIQSTFIHHPEVQALIKRIFYTTKSIPEVFCALYIPVATLRIPFASTETAPETRTKLKSSTTGAGLLSLLPSLPTLHLALIISASRLDTIHNLPTLNFNLVFAHYTELISRSRLQATASGAIAVGVSVRQWSRDTAQAAWEDLARYECIVPASGAAAGAGLRDGGSAGTDSVGGEGASVRMWRIDVTLEELEWSVKEKWKEGGGVRDVLAKWCREI